MGAVLERLLAETARLRKERSSLFHALVAHQRSTPGSEINRANSSISGLWHTPDGLVRLVQQGSDVFGEFQHGGNEWVGDIIGRIVEDRVVYRWAWKDGSLKGVGFWRINEERLHGPYWFESESCSYEESLSHPDRLFTADSSAQDEFNLSRFIEPSPPGSPRVDLTNTELAVARLICVGTPNKMIAAQLGVSVKTVQAYRARAMAKLGVSSLGELSAAMIRAGLRQP
jgi:DNA-binding CsgD family transcriptional regulator